MRVSMCWDTYRFVRLPSSRSQEVDLDLKVNHVAGVMSKMHHFVLKPRHEVGI